MRRQRDGDAVVNVEPLRVVVVLFSLNRDLRHERKSFREIGKDKFAGDGVALFVVLPMLERCQQFGSSYGAKFFNQF